MSSKDLLVVSARHLAFICVQDCFVECLEVSNNKLKTLNISCNGGNANKFKRVTNNIRLQTRKKKIL